MPSVETPQKTLLGRPAAYCTLAGTTVFRANFLTSPTLSPLPILHVNTPLKRQPELISSPACLKMDLFTQMLAATSETNEQWKTPGLSEEAYGRDYEEGREEDRDEEEEEDEQQVEDSQEDSQREYLNIKRRGLRALRQRSQSSSCSSNDGDQSDSNSLQQRHGSRNNFDSASGLSPRKRRRKSTAQIRMLKQQLLNQDSQPNWTKQKIVEMAHRTGLSQSQVYKWCWDQRKKKVGGYQEKFKENNGGNGVMHRFEGKQLQQSESMVQPLCQIVNSVKGHHIYPNRLQFGAMGALQNFTTNQSDATRKVNKRLMF